MSNAKITLERNRLYGSFTELVKLARNTPLNGTDKKYHINSVAEVSFVLFGGRLSMSFDDSTSDSTVTRLHFVALMGSDEVFIYDVLALKIGRG